MTTLELLLKKNLTQLMIFLVIVRRDHCAGREFCACHYHLKAGGGGCVHIGPTL